MLILLISLKKARTIANLTRFYYLELILDDLDDLDANHVDHVDNNQEGSQDWKPCKVSQNDHL